MDRLLSLSQAARMAGVRRRDLQEKVQQGELSVFEGSIRMSELERAYPGLDPDASAMLEKVDRIKRSALTKYQAHSLPDSEALAAQNQRLRLALEEARHQLAGHRALARELEERLLGLQEACDRRQSVLLGSLITWFQHQLARKALRPRPTSRR
ncbi:MAG: hypothetical protein PVG98_09800 [Chromatiales bacterium]|jgi:hypothetical protein